MILNEIDFEITKSHVDHTLSSIHESFSSGHITKDEMIEQASDLLNNLNTELRLSEVPDKNLTKFIPIVLQIKIFIKEFS